MCVFNYYRDKNRYPKTSNKYNKDASTQCSMDKKIKKNIYTNPSYYTDPPPRYKSFD